jgi:hypothetical protein
MRIETFDDIPTDGRVITWDITRAKELVARRSVMEVEMDCEQMAGIMEHDTWDEAKLPAVDQGSGQNRGHAELHINIVPPVTPNSSLDFEVSTGEA